MPAAWPRYQADQTYAWNYEHAPEPIEVDVPPIPGDWTFCGRPVGSPIGIPAGPLLNGKWILYYSELGFDVLTYKTVRSGERPCFPLPNLVPVAVDRLHGHESSVRATTEPSASWAVSFGMPSMSPDIWRDDIEWTRSRLPSSKVLVVSVVGTVRPEWSLTDLAQDYARCAVWAAQAGADAIEMNFSCPNVSTCDGQLYQTPADAALVANEVRQAIGCLPLLVKIGHVPRDEDAERLIESLSGVVDGLVMTNTLATTVITEDGRSLFDGQRRGICGRATLAASLEQTRLFGDLVRRRGDRLTLVGVGGASTAADVLNYLAAGANSVHLATAAMLNPTVGIDIRRELAGTN